MERLTVNKKVSDMNMVELAHNSCYAKENKARYRDYGMDIDVRELTIGLLGKFADIPNEFTCDEDFDDFMLDSLQYGTDNILGLIALFYRNLWAQADLYERLKRYEDLEEQGLLKIFPCKVGDTLYYIYPEYLDRKIEEYTVTGFCFYKHACQIRARNHKGVVVYFFFESIGKTVFFTQTEAEKQMEGK